MGKKSIANVIWLALVCAKDDRLSLIDAYDGDETVGAVIKAREAIKDFTALQIKLFGTDQTMLQAAMSKTRSRDIIKMIANGEEFEEEKEN